MMRRVIVRTLLWQNLLFRARHQADSRIHQIGHCLTNWLMLTKDDLIKLCVRIRYTRISHRVYHAIQDFGEDRKNQTVQLTVIA